ncbi:LysM domain receptor-like kinase 3 [Apostasia shenzhenica]|uniref:LysM domain receptor-like kinase 3 n=1 Tax=Apostasia shenzhenica TaxID=1088818 RepID=A0A2I0ACK3_9ASPA|nr:LysM domain receptor-like kinase 3 [Apostasia shenzhenica]
MCKRQADALASQPRRRSLPRRSSNTASSYSSSFATVAGTSSASAQGTSNGGEAAAASSSSAASWSISSIASLRDSLPDAPAMYSFAEIAAATNNFLGKRLSSSSSSWRCSLHGKDAAVFQRHFSGDPVALPAKIAAVCRSHHRSLIRLLGASISGNYIYLVYEFSPGASLTDCLRSPRNPHFTLLSSWVSRVQIAADLAQGLDYIHNHSACGGSVHNRMKSSAVIVSDPGLNAKICHFGAAFLVGAVPSEDKFDGGSVKIEGTRGYLAPEVIAGGGVSRRSDVFAFGVVLLELISGDVPVKYRYNGIGKNYEMASLIETAREVMGPAEGVENGMPEPSGEAAVRGMRVQRLVDRRLKDSFPEEVAEKLTRVALRCVEAEPAKRPEMSWVEGKISKLFLDSKAWQDRIRVPADFSVSFAPR